jgi:cyclopropane fatty-acyl-phospholipid synthase-like methyltransferase
MRQRYFKVVETLSAELARREGELKVLTLPSGIPRDLSELAASDPAGAKRIRYTGMDLDPEVLDAALQHLQGVDLGSVEFLQGNALIGSSYPRERFDFIASTGLGEFLNDEDLARFYWHVFDALEPGGLFFTSATAYERKSDFLMKAFEMEAHYRDRARVEEIFRALPWSELKLELDPSGLQTFVRARK